MRVNQSTSNSVQSGDAASVSKSGHTEKAERAKRQEGASRSSAIANESAKTEISAKGRDFAQAKAVASSAPDVREDKVAELKKKIAGGHYRVDADAIANRLVDEHLKMEGLT